MDYLLQIFIIFFIYFTKIYCDNSTESYSSTQTTTSTSTTSIGATSQPSTSSTTTTLMNEISTKTVTSSGGTTPSTYATSVVTSSTVTTTSSTKSSTSTPTSIVTSMNEISTKTVTSSGGTTSSTYTTSVVINSTVTTTSSTTYSTSTTTSSVTTQPISKNISLIYKYTVGSSETLKTGNFTTPSVLTSVQNMVRSSFNLSGFSITVIRVEIRSQAKADTRDMFTENLFQITRTDCDAECIDSAKLNSIPPQNFTLIAANGSVVDASAKSSPSLVSNSGPTNSTTPNYQKGESPPGLAANLGMGLGITFMALIIIIEVIYFTRKYGCSGSTRQSDYELTSNHHRLSVS